MSSRWFNQVRLMIMLISLLLLFEGVVMQGYALEPSADPLLRIETGGHLANITAVAIDKAGKIVATTSVDKTVRLWKTGSGKLLHTLRVPIDEDREGVLNAVAVSPDGRFVAVGGITGKAWDGHFSIYIFDVETGHMVRQVPGFAYIIHSIKFSQDGNLIAVASGDTAGELSVIKADTAQFVARYAFASSCDAVDLSVKGEMAVVTQDGNLHLYKSPTDATVRKIQFEKSFVSSRCLFNPKGTSIAVGFAANMAVALVDVNSMAIRVQRPAMRYAANQYGIATLAWSNDGEVLYASGQPHKAKGKIVFIWNNGGYGSESNLSIPLEVVTRTSGLVVTDRGNLFFAIGLSGVGEIDTDGNIRYFNPLERASFQKNHDSFATSPDGSIVRFSYMPYSQDPAAFNIIARSFVKVDDVDELVTVPSRTANDINLKNWDSWGIFSKLVPTLNKKQLLDFGDIRDQPFCFGIAADAETFFIGTSSTLRKFNKFGKPLWRIPVSSSALALALSKDARLLVVGFTDGTIRWYSQVDGKEQIAFFPHPDRKRWVVWTPEGYFDASLGGSDLVGYHINQGKEHEAKFTPMSYLYDVFYRPDIIQARLKGDDIRELVTLTAEEALRSPPPEITFSNIPTTTIDTKAKFCYQLKNTGGGIGELRLFQNGKLVRSDGYYREATKRGKLDKKQIAGMNSRALYADLRSLVVREKKSNGTSITKPKGNLVNECVELDAIAGENKISLAAFNASNTVQSFLKSFSFTSSRAPDDPHLYILSVGIDRYRDSTINLKYASKDAMDFVLKLPEKARSLYRPENIHLVKLVNEEAGKQNILKTIDDLAGKIKHGESFIFFNASHGVLLQNQYYIVTADFNGDLENADSLISSNEIVAISKKIRSLSQLFIFDTCHAGGVDNIVSGLYDARMSVLAMKMGLHIFASAGSVQTAMDGYKGNGLYTYTLLQGIENGSDVDREKNGKVSVKELGLYSQKKTTEISAKLGHPQIPVIINFGLDNPLFVVR